MRLFAPTPLLLHPDMITGDKRTGARIDVGPRLIKLDDPLGSLVFMSRTGVEVLLS